MTARLRTRIELDSLLAAAGVAAAHAATQDLAIRTEFVVKHQHELRRPMIIALTGVLMGTLVMGSGIGIVAVIIAAGLPLCIAGCQIDQWRESHERRALARGCEPSPSAPVTRRAAVSRPSRCRTR